MNEFELNDLTSRVVKGREDKDIFRDAVLECIPQLNRFMELMETELGTEKDKDLVYRAALNLYAELLDKTKAYLESEYS